MTPQFRQGQRGRALPRIVDPPQQPSSPGWRPLTLWVIALDEDSVGPEVEEGADLASSWLKFQETGT